MEFYKVTMVWYDTKNIQHQDCPVTMTSSDVKGFARNSKSINWEGVNNIVYDKDSKRIIQAGGYSRERGLFCDLY